jgi:signal transduction histidine kinase
MNLDLLRHSIEKDRDVITARKFAREISAAMGFGAQDQVRIATAVSEIAQNALAHASGGIVSYSVRTESQSPQLVMVVRDHGRGIADLDEVLGVEYGSSERRSVGIVGAQRLMDRCDVMTAAGSGTVVTLVKSLPPNSPVDRTALARLGERLAETAVAASFEEDRLQNRQLLQTLSELRSRQEELVALTRELEDTNRGVVALYAEIEEKAEHLRRADAMKSRFLSNTSHELRTPLSSIRALAQLLLAGIDGELNEAQVKQVTFIEKAAEDLTDLVNDLLDLAKIEAGKIDVKPVRFTVDELFSTLRGMLRPLESVGAVELIFENESAAPVLQTDEGKLSQILRNFISNALKFTEKGEVKVKAIQHPGEPVMHLAVSDTGLGIAESDLQLIFEEFSQIENPLQKRSKGTGLGLPLCKKLAELLGGSIAVQSAPGKGSTFTLTIPVDYTAAQVPDFDPNAASASRLQRSPHE